MMVVFYCWSYFLVYIIFIAVKIVMLLTYLYIFSVIPISYPCYTLGVCCCVVKQSENNAVKEYLFMLQISLCMV